MVYESPEHALQAAHGIAITHIESFALRPK